MDEHETKSTPPLDAAKANAELTENPGISQADAAGTDEWTRLDDGAGIAQPKTRQNLRLP